AGALFVDVASEGEDEVLRPERGPERPRDVGVPDGLDAGHRAAHRAAERMPVEEHLAEPLLPELPVVIAGVDELGDGFALELREPARGEAGTAENADEQVGKGAE